MLVKVKASPSLPSLAKDSASCLPVYQSGAFSVSK